ncbi:hypothetical protein HY612_04785 [Candidatus Roizmanbacteria bacterium]|nr:hypothetical protein [Candidatus Roizmanbacteria bacterium]
MRTPQTILGLLMVVLIVGIIAYVAIFTYINIFNLERNGYFKTKETCQAKTLSTCSPLMCDLISSGETVEEVCGKDFSDGYIWFPVRR